VIDVQRISRGSTLGFIDRNADIRFTDPKALDNLGIACKRDLGDVVASVRSESDVNKMSLVSGTP